MADILSDEFTDGIIDFTAVTTGTGVSIGANPLAIEIPGDTDWFVFGGIAGTRIQFDLKGSPSGDGSLTDTFIRGIFTDIDPGAGVIIEEVIGNTDDDTGEGNNARVIFTLPDIGPYWIAAGAAGNNIGTYTFDAAIFSPDGGLDDQAIDDIDNNITTDKNIVFPPDPETLPDIAHSFVSTIGVEGDTDWFRFGATVDQVIQFNVEGLGGDPTDTAIRGIFFDDGFGNIEEVPNSRDDDSGPGLDAQITFIAPADNLYYISVGADTSGSIDNNTGAYEITSSIFVDDYPNDVSTTAELDVDNSSNTGTIEQAGDTDWFLLADFDLIFGLGTINIPVGQVIRIDLTGDDSSGNALDDPFIRGIFDSSGQEIPGNTDDDSGPGLNSSVTFTIPSEETFFISAGAFGNKTGDYSISATIASADGGLNSGAVGDIPNDLFSISTFPDTIGTPFVSGTDGFNSIIESAGDTDWFSIVLTEDQTIQFDMTGNGDTSSLSDPFIRGVFDSTGAEIFGNRDDDGGDGLNSQVTFTAPADGTYYVSAGAFSTGTGPYNISATDVITGADGGVDPGTPGDVPNNNTSTAVLAIDSQTTGTIDASGDTDWFGIPLTAGTIIQFDLTSSTNPDALSDPFIRGIFDGAGVLVSEDTINDDGGIGINARVTFTVPADDIYFISAGAYEDGIGSYIIGATDVSPVI